MWDEFLKNEMNKEYFKVLKEKYDEAYKTSTVYPVYDNIFNAFKLTNLNDIKVVILGQDPYHGINQAHGLSFSSLDNKTPKSLLNIKKELNSDLGITITSNNDLTSWANQGVFLLNTILTVEESKPLSHTKYGWEEFTLNVFKEICKLNKPIVFILWGNNARKYKEYILNDKHLIIESVHPSPLSASRGFFGSKPFSKTNDFLIKNNIKPVDFNI